MKFTVVIVGPDGRAATSLRVNAQRLVAGVLLVTGVAATAIWIGWKVGELTALL
jgi:hypothetical protein